MKRQFDKILLVTLWVLCITLGACFWFNTIFGFNVFSASHWQQLAYMQAAHQSVRPAFYASLVAAVVIGLWGLYILVRPRRRHIKFNNSTTPNQTTASTLDIIAAEKPVAAAPAPTHIAMKRPPRLSIGATLSTSPVPPQTVGPQMPAMNNMPVTTPDFDEIRAIFESVGYTIKRGPQIANLRPALFAIGTDEILWIGAVGVEDRQMMDAVKKLDQVFSDTLDSIKIHIHAFIVNPKDARDNDNEILKFNNVSQLRDYMAAHPNPPLPENDNGNFAAYSEYIDTVVEFIGKV